MRNLIMWVVVRKDIIRVYSVSESEGRPVTRTGTDPEISVKKGGIAA